MRMGPNIAFGSVTGKDDRLHNDLLPSPPPGNEPRTLPSAGGFSAFSLSPVLGHDHSLPKRETQKTRVTSRYDLPFYPILHAQA
jgi:hypothetical protein